MDSGRHRKHAPPGYCWELRISGSMFIFLQHHSALPSSVVFTDHTHVHLAELHRARGLGSTCPRVRTRVLRRVAAAALQLSVARRRDPCSHHHHCSRHQAEPAQACSAVAGHLQHWPDLQQHNNSNKMIQQQPQLSPCARPGAPRHSCWRWSQWTENRERSVLVHLADMRPSNEYKDKD